MRHPFRHPHFRRPRFYRRFRYPFFRRGRLLGLIGLTALGYTLLDRHQGEQRRRTSNAYVDVEPQNWQGG